MRREADPPLRTLRPSRFIVAGAYLLYAAVVLRTLANPNIQARLPAYLVLEGACLVLFTLMLWRPAPRIAWRHANLALQALLILGLVALRPRFDFIVILFVLLSFQAVLALPDRAGWVWVGINTTLTPLCLMAGYGPLQGLALALMPMTIGLVFPAYVAVTRQVERGLSRTGALLAELQDANLRLTALAAQAEELSAIQERNRLARQLHDSVSQTIFSISLQTRAAQILAQRDPGRLRAQLEQLRSLAHNALEEMRGLIAQLRPAPHDPSAPPTP